MASDRDKFKNSLRKWDQLRDQEFFSVPKNLGKTAIFCSYAIIDLVGERLYKKGHKDVKSFRKEAFSIADRITEEGKQAEVILNASDIDFDFILHDESFSDIITIGHGNLSMLIINDEENIDQPIDWYDLSSFTDHLKTGNFVQRQCGTFGRDISVPLGMFCVSNHCDVVAPIGLPFNPRGLNHPANELLDYVTEQPRLDYQSAKSNFSY